MSHVVGEVTYVELFKDAEGKSRVSEVDDLLHEVLNTLRSFIFVFLLVKMFQAIYMWIALKLAGNCYITVGGFVEVCWGFSPKYDWKTNLKFIT